MSATGLENTLRRKVRRSQKRAGLALLSEARAWRLMLPKTSERVVGTAAVVEGFRETKAEADAILAQWDEFILAMGLNGPDETRGLVFADAEMRSALLEVQTVGRVCRGVSDRRAATTIDAELMGYVIDEWLSTVREALNLDTGVWTCARLLPDVRAARLALDEREYTLQDILISFGDDTRTGRLRIVRPDTPRTGSVVAETDVHDSMIMAVETDLQAVLHRSSVPLGWLRRMAPGMLLDVPRASVARIRMEDRDARCVALARLGRSQGARAVCINATGGAMPKGELEALEGGAPESDIGDEGPDPEEGTEGDGDVPKL